MNFGVFATTVFSLAVLNGAYAENNKDRVFVEARWYTEAYVKQSLANINPRLLSAAFPPMANYVFAADTPGLRPEGENLLKKEVWSIEGGFVRWPPKKDGKTLKTQWDDMCVTLSARGLKGLYYEARLRSRLTTPKDLVISRIETGELVSAPSSLDASRGRDRGYEVIKVIPPRGEGKMRCNIYKTMRRGYVRYDISVVLIAPVAYLKPPNRQAVR
ncbi:hypothetical protein H8F21_22310 [Pseudomonas sp. P66]|jgi:hypothetical protein|uniref:Uncharacterized protein n=1 Tax=Pseudomonas arcuscaelestis TaxID=2710591 RepID=A0ABS2C352_9PSED|nr:hypothetical protein [Pseudomonas arcuscaelestis]MBM3111403.1 hypothetical protein [Pseudomonas arcuscaelestis]MBM5460301.1 hypothetical protein [Pseudomonas arcuscaelestis]